jgi:hypothetical protein
MFSANSSKPFFTLPNAHPNATVSPNFFSSVIKSVVVVLDSALLLQK